MKNITLVLLCGGSGTRLWPISRGNLPKQFIQNFDNKSLFQKTILRTLHINCEKASITDIIIVTSRSFQYLVHDQIDELDLKLPVNIILEPLANNTAPALTLAALHSIEKHNDNLFIILPTDHYFNDDNHYSSHITRAIEETKKREIFLFGIKPKRASSSHGYIKFSGKNEVKQFEEFIEKPSQAILSKIMKGNYAWNLGIFIMHPSTWIDLMQKLQNDNYGYLLKAWNERQENRNNITINELDYAKSEVVSIDYAIMEEIKNTNINVKVSIFNSGWSDLGTYKSYLDINMSDNNNYSLGNNLFFNSKNNVIMSNKRKTFISNINNITVVDSEDVLLVADLTKDNSIPDVVNYLKENEDPLLENTYNVTRPWGTFEILKDESGFKVKIIEIKPQQAISLQKHFHRAEHWFVIDGVATVTLGDKLHTLSRGDSIYIDKEEIHRIENKADNILKIVEIQIGNSLREDDIERLEDLYDR